MPETDADFEMDIADELRQAAGNLIDGVIEDGEVPVSLLSNAADEIDRLRAALKFARKRIEYYGTISDRRHFDHDLVEVYPKIDGALNQQTTRET